MTRSPSRCSCCGQCSYTATEGVLILLRGGNAALVLVCVVFIGEYRVLVASRETISISGMRRFLRARPLGIQKSENTDSRHERLSWERRRSERAREGESRCRGRPREGAGAGGPPGVVRPEQTVRPWLDTGSMAPERTLCWTAMAACVCRCTSPPRARGRRNHPPVITQQCSRILNDKSHLSHSPSVGCESDASRAGAPTSPHWATYRDAGAQRV